MHFSEAVKVVSMKPCIVIILLDTLLKTQHVLVFLTYISRFTDFVKIYVQSGILCSNDSRGHCQIYVKSRTKVDLTVAVIAV